MPDPPAADRLAAFFRRKALKQLGYLRRERAGTDSNRGAFLRAVGTLTAIAAIARFFPRGMAQRILEYGIKGDVRQAAGRASATMRRENDHARASFISPAGAIVSLHYHQRW